MTTASDTHSREPDPLPPAQEVSEQATQLETACNSSRLWSVVISVSGPVLDQVVLGLGLGLGVADKLGIVFVGYSAAVADIAVVVVVAAVVGSAVGSSTAAVAVAAVDG